MKKRGSARDEERHLEEPRLRGKPVNYSPPAQQIAYATQKCPKVHFWPWSIPAIMLALAIHDGVDYFISHYIHAKSVPIVAHHKVRHYSEEVKTVPQPVFYIRKEEPAEKIEKLPPDDMSGTIPNGGVPVKTPEPPATDNGGCPAGSEMHGGACAKY